MRWRVRQRVGPWVSRMGWRWRIAHWLNKSSKYCWCDLVDWVLKHKAGQGVDPGEEQYLFWPAENYSPLILDLFRRRPDTRCALSAARDGTCYCGKFRTAAAEAAHSNLREAKGVVVKEAS